MMFPVDKVVLIFLFLLYYASITIQQQERACVSHLPKFVNQEERGQSTLPVGGIQALVPSYTFTCKARILQWGVAVIGTAGHGIHLQVWRPVPVTRRGGVNLSYAYVGSNYYPITPWSGEKLIYLAVDEVWRLTVESGDVIGFYLEDNTTTTDDFRLQHQQNVTGCVVQYGHIQQPLSYSSVIHSNTLPLRLTDSAPIITVHLDPIATQTSNQSPATTRETPPTTWSSAPPPLRSSQKVGVATTGGMATSVSTPASHPHPMWPSGVNRSHILIACVVVVGGACAAVLLVAIALGVWSRKGRSQNKSAQRPEEGGGSTLSLSGTMLTVNPAYDHTHNGLIASWDWLPKHVKTKYRIWRAHDYERPVVMTTGPSPGDHTHLERSQNHYEYLASFLQSVHHYEQIPVASRPHPH